MCSSAQGNSTKNINHLGELLWKQMLLSVRRCHVASLAASIGKMYIESCYESGICTKSPRELIDPLSISFCQNESSFDVTSQQPRSQVSTTSTKKHDRFHCRFFGGDLLQPRSQTWNNYLKQLFETTLLFSYLFFFLRQDSFPWTHMTIKEDNDISCGSITSCTGQWVYWYRK